MAIEKLAGVRFQLVWAFKVKKVVRVYTDDGIMH